MSDYLVFYNNISDKSIGVHAKSRPSVPAPVRRVTDYTLAGRDGSLYDTDDSFSDIKIPITFSYRHRDKSQWFTIYREVKKWLLTRHEGTLEFSDDTGYYYKVKDVVITTTERIAWTIGEITAEFICEPFTYLLSGDNETPMENVMYNDGYTCHPIYRISGTGECTLTVNGNSFVVTVSLQTTIDTDKMLTFDSATMLANTTATGDYQELWFKPGSNSLSITAGFSCDIIPQWRWL